MQGLGAAVEYVVYMVMSVIGGIDDGFSVVMRAVGVPDPHLQLIFGLLFLVVAVILALCIVGGGLGWIILLFCVLLLLHRIVPGLGAPGGLPVASPLQNATQQ
jgi:hypothetical protein